MGDGEVPVGQSTINIDCPEECGASLTVPVKFSELSPGGETTMAVDAAALDAELARHVHSAAPFQHPAYFLDL